MYILTSIELDRRYREMEMIERAIRRVERSRKVARPGARAHLASLRRIVAGIERGLSGPDVDVAVYAMIRMDCQIGGLQIIE